MTTINHEHDEHDPSRASAPVRHESILKHLGASGFIDIGTLVEELAASESTIRRDLSELEKRGLLRRTHGGAVANPQVSRDTETEVREVLNVEEKSRIGERAAEMIVDGDTVMIDSGTTSRQVALRLAGNPTLTFVTNGFDVFTTLISGGAKNVHFIGGEYIPINHSFGGSLAVQMVRNYNVDKAVLSVMSVDVRRMCICTLSPQIGCVQEAIISIANQVIVVADHSKFGRAGFSVIAPLDNIDYIITDTKTRAFLAQAPEKIMSKCLFA